jgi:BirA family transcriptional regulator, biotin operon repressor / biotin---[acetyl-CoA-carboxylase] ligase
LSSDTDWPEGVGRLVLDEVDSTMAEAQRRAADLTGACWILAAKQTAGRGRRGRAWTDPAGNFAATLVMRTQDAPAKLALRSFTAALALRESLVALTGLDGAFKLKWPNDVLLNGGKLSGILLESLGAGALAVGIGVNLRAAPPRDPEAALPPVDLRSETGIVLLPEQLLAQLAPAFERWEQRLRIYGFEPVRNAFLSHAVRLGEPVTARTMTDTHHGVFDSIDDTGALVLKTAQGRVVVPTADIFFP